MSEASERISSIRAWLMSRQLDALYLQRVSSFAWATCGAASYVNTAVTFGEASLLITQKNQILITNNIEAIRLEKEADLIRQGWQFQISPWYEVQPSPGELAHGMKIGGDACLPGVEDVSAEVARLRANLSTAEVGRFRDCCNSSARAMEATIKSVRPGQTEYEIGALLEQEVQSRGVQPIVVLIATDERIFSFRHPLPTEKKLDRYAMLVLCGRQHGLVCSITRLVHFGPLPMEVQRKAEAVARIDAATILATRPGRTTGDVFECLMQAYAEASYPNEWRFHHQGGPAGYEPREYLAVPGSKDIIAAGQTYAWNPSISGAKSEDTVLISDDGFEVLTATPALPSREVEVDGKIVERPDILVVE